MAPCPRPHSESRGQRGGPEPRALTLPPTILQPLSLWTRGGLLITLELSTRSRSLALRQPGHPPAGLLRDIFHHHSDDTHTRTLPSPRLPGGGGARGCGKAGQEVLSAGSCRGVPRVRFQEARMQRGGELAGPGPPFLRGGDLTESAASLSASSVGAGLT